MKTPDYAAIHKVYQFDNPYLRHYSKEYNLNERETVVLGILLELTNQCQCAIKTLYSLIAEKSGFPKKKVFELINSLRFHQIIDAVPDGNYIRIEFLPLKKRIEEISVAFDNSKRLGILEKDVRNLSRQDFLPKKEIYDNIYPIIGELVSRRIAEALRRLIYYINKKLDSGLSFKMWRYRITARIKGVSISELVLRDSLPFIINEIFIIHKESGIVIAHSSREREGGVDEDLVGGMLTAISDFTETAFQKKGKRKNDKSSLDEITFGEEKIILKGAPSFYSAFVVYGIPDMNFIEQTDSLNTRLHKSYSRKMKNFSGDMESVSPVADHTDKFLQTYNTPEDSNKKESLLKVKILGVILAGALIFFLVHSVLLMYNDNILEKQTVNAIDTINSNRFDIRVNARRGRVRLQGFAATSGDHEQMMKMLHKRFPGTVFDDKVMIVDLSQVMKYGEAVNGLSSRVTTLELERVAEELKTHVVRFPINRAAIEKNQIFEIQKIYEILQLHPEITVDIVAFADNTGSFEINKTLAQKRMEAVSGKLREMGIADKRLRLFPFNPELIAGDPRLQKFIDERGIMLFPVIDKNTE